MFNRLAIQVKVIVVSANDLKGACKPIVIRSACPRFQLLLPFAAVITRLWPVLPDFGGVAASANSLLAKNSSKAKMRPMQSRGEVQHA
jgi:hypothetical protein